MAKRRFLGILFRCCRVYGRAYLNPGRTAFTGRCPRCLRPIRIAVSPRGSRSRFFSAG